MIELEDVSHSYVVEGRREATVTHVLDGFSLSVPRLQFLAIVGASGCGKTTLLRVVAGLLRPDAGRVTVNGTPVARPGPDRPIVFQDAGLYPWRTVRANIRLGLELSGIARGDEARRIVDSHLRLVGLTDFADHYPAQLSGGMRQRVGLARALAVSPPILLMDEPFGSVDAITRRRLGSELLRIWQQDQRTVVFVTHSIEEALTLADRVVLLRDGRVMWDAPVELPRPRDPDAVAEEPEFLELRRALWELL